MGESVSKMPEYGIKPIKLAFVLTPLAFLRISRGVKYRELFYARYDWGHRRATEVNELCRFIDESVGIKAVVLEAVC